GRRRRAAYLAKPIRRALLEECLRAVLVAEPAAAPAALVTRHGIAAASALRRPRVLVAEDNEVNQKVTVRLLERLACRPDVAVNGREAVRAVRSTAYDLVLMDCQMPEMDGFEAT